MSHFFGKESEYSILRARIALGGALAYALIGGVAFYIALSKNISHIFDPIYLMAIVIVYCPLFWVVYYFYKKEDTEANDFIQGLRGEDVVANSLKKLPEVYSVFADAIIEGKSSNIDFVLVGPTGVYAIEVKSHRGQIGFNGLELTRYGELLEKDFLKQVKSEALSLHNYLKDELKVDIYIKPVIVFSRARLNFGLKPIDDVFIIQKQWIQKLLATHPFYRFPIERKVIEEKLKSLVVFD